VVKKAKKRKPANIGKVHFFDVKQKTRGREIKPQKLFENVYEIILYLS